MRIFLSYASPDKTTAESVAFSLRGRDHKVFLDRDDLPPGESFDQQIELAVNGSDIFLFLISPESVAEGHYTLTELAFARRKWPSPNNRVLPVMARKTPLEEIPPYLKAVTILEPVGNIAAETSGAVNDMARRLIGWDIGKTILFSWLASVLSILTVQEVTMNVMNPEFVGLWTLLMSYTDRFSKLYLIPACISGTLAGMALRRVRHSYFVPIIIGSGLLYAALTRLAFHFMTMFPISDIWLVIWSVIWSVGFAVFYFGAALLFGGPRFPFARASSG